MNGEVMLPVLWTAHTDGQGRIGLRHMALLDCDAMNSNGMQAYVGGAVVGIAYV